MHSSCWSRSLFWVGCLFFGGLASPLWSQTAIFIQGVAQGFATDLQYQTDVTYIRGNHHPDAPMVIQDSGNWGGASIFDLGLDLVNRSRGVLRFPISALNGQVTHLRRARLIVTQMNMPFTTLPSNQLPASIHFELYRIQPANANWSEGVSRAGEVQSKTISWAFLSNDDVPWAGGKGCGVAGVDYVEAPISSATMSQADWTIGRQLAFDIDRPDLLQSWITRPQENAGFLLRSSTLESLPDDTIFQMHFYSDEAVNPLLRPRLEVEYDAIPNGPMAQASFQTGVADSSCDTQATSLFAGVDGSYGAAGTLSVGFESTDVDSRPWRSLIRFDLTRLHNMSTAARWMRLTLTVQSIQGNGLSSNPLAGFYVLQLHPVSSANAAWKEGRSAAGEAESGAATWRWLAQGASAWAGGAAEGAGLDQPDIDYDAHPLASRLLVPSELHPGDQLAFDFPAPGVIERWINKPEINAGFRLSAPGLERVGELTPGSIGKIMFYSDDATNPAVRPRLDVFYATDIPRSAADTAWRMAE